MSCHPDPSAWVTSSCYPCRHPGWQQPKAQLYLLCVSWLPDASTVHLAFASEPQISSLSLHPLLLVQHPDVEKRSLCTLCTLSLQRCMRIDPGNQGPGGIRNIPVLSGCEFHPPCHGHPSKMCLEELPQICVPWICISHILSEL